MVEVFPSNLNHYNNVHQLVFYYCAKRSTQKRYNIVFVEYNNVLVSEFMCKIYGRIAKDG